MEAQNNTILIEEQFTCEQNGNDVLIVNKGTYGACEFEIFNRKGNLVSKGNFTSTFIVKSLMSGLYVFVINNAVNTEVKKVIIE